MTGKYLALDHEALTSLRSFQIFSLAALPSLSKSTYHSRSYYTIRGNRLDQSFLSVHNLVANSPPQNTSNHGIHFSFFLFFFLIPIMTW